MQCNAMRCAVSEHRIDGIFSCHFASKCLLQCTLSTSTLKVIIVLRDDTQPLKMCIKCTHKQNEEKTAWNKKSLTLPITHTHTIQIDKMQIYKKPNDNQFLLFSFHLLCAKT